MTISRRFSSTAFIPPGATSVVPITGTKSSLKAHLLRGQLRQTVRVRDVEMHEQPAPAALHGVEVLAVKRDARADDLHVARAVAPDRPARAERYAVLRLELHLLLEEELRQVGVRR